MPISARQVLEALRETTLPVDLRTYMHTGSKVKKKAMTFGRALCYGSGWTVSSATKRYPDLARLLCRYGKERFPKFAFSSITVNSGGSALHVDPMNCGPSMIVSFGEHEGGELWQYPGKIMKIHNKPRLSNGLLPHMTLPFTGERYSLVYYNMAGDRAQGQRAPLKADDAAYLRGFGFAVKPSIFKCAEHEPQRELLPLAAQILRAAGVPSKAIGSSYKLKANKRNSRK